MMLPKRRRFDSERARVEQDTPYARWRALLLLRALLFCHDAIRRRQRVTALRARYCRYDTLF